jgi:ABC-type lipoprotein release transport system permease subunit
VILGLIIGAVMETTLFYVNVISKKRMIAILKAVGTKNSSIILIYLIQGAIYGVIASVLGVFFGFFVTSYLEANPWFIQETGKFLTTRFDIYSALIASALTVVISIVASLYPAYRAAKTDMVEAMRT